MGAYLEDSLERRMNFVATVPLYCEKTLVLEMYTTLTVSR